MQPSAELQIDLKDDYEEITTGRLVFTKSVTEVHVCENGAGVEFSEEVAKKVLLEDEIQIIVSVGDGQGKATAYGCDLTYDYVKINGDYRS